MILKIEKIKLTSFLMLNGQLFPLNPTKTYMGKYGQCTIVHIMTQWGLSKYTQFLVRCENICFMMKFNFHFQTISHKIFSLCLVEWFEKSHTILTFCIKSKRKQNCQQIAGT